MMKFPQGGCQAADIEQESGVAINSPAAIYRIEPGAFNHARKIDGFLSRTIAYPRGSRPG
jgi:hypothetical protein